MTSAFIEALKALNPETSPSTWLFVSYDQLNHQMGPLSRREPSDIGIVLVENRRKGRRRPYHKQKLALILANMRHFALEEARRGIRVEYIAGEDSYANLLRQAIQSHGKLVAMRPAERELRVDLQSLVDESKLEWVEHDGWMTTPEQFQKACGEPPWRMDSFYRGVRQESGILMEDGKPAGGRYSHDGDNREFWDGTPDAPRLPTFETDEITREVIELVEREFADHPGEVKPEHLPATADDAEALWQWALDECMQYFGPYEDAMSTRSRNLFHTRASQLINLHRLLPTRVVDDVERLDVPINSKEGFIRQVLGWREFMRHVHEATDGFRSLGDEFGGDGLEISAPGDAGFGDWRGEPWPTDTDHDSAAPNKLDADFEVPPAFWGTPSGMKCLDEVVDMVWNDAHSHHITRLMVLGNIATLIEIEPRALTDWFWVAYDDAYDWVVEPNVLGMATFGVGELFTTKPYVSGSNYINKMSNYCGECAFHPKNDCPIGRLYWAFLDRHEELLSDNRRMNLIMGSLRKRSDEKKALDRRTFEWVRSTLADGKELLPDDAPE